MSHCEQPTPAVRLRRFLLQFRRRALRLPAKRRLRFFHPLFRSAYESDFPAAPSRSSLQDKTARHATLCSPPLPDSNPYDPSRVRIPLPHCLLREPAPPSSRLRRPGRRRPGQKPSAKVAREKPPERPASSPFHKVGEERHPSVLPPFRKPL